MPQAAHLGDDVPRTIGGYELLAPIGEGGMGRVFLARRAIVGGIRRNYAIKLLHSNLRAERDVADQLLEEAKLAAHVTHPNVVQVLQGGEEDGHVFVVMEYVEAVTLASLVRHALSVERPIPLGIVARVISDALAGLHAAHEAVGQDGEPLGLVHRDFSPQNILVSADGIAKLTDFGIAKAITRIGGTATGIVKGKVAYLSPEQAMGHSLDRRSDVWAAGVVLWESLARRRLFDESTDTATLLRIVSGPRVAPPSSQWPEVPPAVDEVVLAALERDRGARIHDAEELRQRLVQAVGLEHRLAHHVEVADYVAGLIGERRQRIELDVERLLEADEVTPTSAVRPVPRPAPRPPQKTLPMDLLEDVEDPESDDGEPATAPDAPSSLRVRQGSSPAATDKPLKSVRATSPLLILCMWLAVVGLIAFVAFRFATRQADALVPSVSVPTVSIPPPAPVLEVRVVADEPIAQLSLDGQHRLLPKPSDDIAVPLSTPVGEAGLAVVALTDDGREATGRVDAGQAVLELFFPPADEEAGRSDDEAAEKQEPKPATVRPIRPVVRPPVAPKPRPKDKPKAPGLGPSPYAPHGSSP